MMMNQHFMFNENGSAFSGESYYDETASSYYCHHNKVTVYCDICNRVSGLWLVFPLYLSLTENSSLPLSEAVLPSLNISMTTTFSLNTLSSQHRIKATITMMIKTNLSLIAGSPKTILSRGRLQRVFSNVSTQGSGWLDWSCLKIRSLRPNHSIPKKLLGSRT